MNPLHTNTMAKKCHFESNTRAFHLFINRPLAHNYRAKCASLGMKQRHLIGATIRTLAYARTARYCTSGMPSFDSHKMPIACLASCATDFIAQAV